HPRPFMDGVSPNFLHHVADSSFPSDHATVLFALAFSLWLTRLPATRWTGAILLAAALAVGWARVFLGAHYPLDILGGAGIGFAFAATFALNPLRQGVERFSDLADRAYFALGAVLVRRAR
ncbi:MAG: phosphatase PAP2 family protein, partial [Hyphomicrobiales bacterium]|nr:phosphatase PAP2 family protein [Hyphomicrobiales bacterium]